MVFSFKININIQIFMINNKRKFKARGKFCNIVIFTLKHTDLDFSYINFYIWPIYTKFAIKIRFRVYLAEIIELQK